MSPGPWIVSAYAGQCSFEGEDFEEGTEIRADGSGGWECRECVETDAALDPDQAWSDQWAGKIRDQIIEEQGKRS